MYLGAYNYLMETRLKSIHSGTTLISNKTEMTSKGPLIKFNVARKWKVLTIFP